MKFSLHQREAVMAFVPFEELRAVHLVALPSLVFDSFFIKIFHFLCSPKENEAKEMAPCVPLLPALLDPAGVLPNSPSRLTAGGLRQRKALLRPALAMLSAGRWV